MTSKPIGDILVGQGDELVSIPLMTVRKGRQSGDFITKQTINANTIDAEVASAMANIDAEYEALCNTYALATV